MTIIRALLLFLSVGIHIPTLGSVSYKGVITADELLVLGSACHIDNKKYQFSLDMCLDFIHLLKVGFSGSRPKYADWQFGKWTDHRDYKYAGHPKFEIDLAPKPVDGIGMDTSHFLAKWPIFISTAVDYYTISEIDRSLFNNLRYRMENSLRAIASISPSSSDVCKLKLKNYTDGTNGLYRYKWKHIDTYKGHPRFGLSSSLFYSSVALLDTEYFNEIYRSIYKCRSQYSLKHQTLFKPYFPSDYELLIFLSQFKPSKPSLSIEENKIANELFERHLKTKLLGDFSYRDKEAYKGIVGQRYLTMHYAFSLHKKHWLDIYKKHFSNYLNYLKSNTSLNIGDYYFKHQIYFSSRFVALSRKYEYEIDFANRLESQLATILQKLYIHGAHTYASRPGWDGVSIRSYKDYFSWKKRYYENTFEDNLE